MHGTSYEISEILGVFPNDKKRMMHITLIYYISVSFTEWRSDLLNTLIQAF